jgi:hypothetical protein
VLSGARTAACAAIAFCALSASAGAAAPTPILSTGLFPMAPVFTGAAASADPVTGVPPTPQNPFMAPNGQSEIHDDGWQTDAYTTAGPLGKNPVVGSSELIRDCGSITFDSTGRIVSVCVGVSGPELFMIDPKTLATLATYPLPPRQSLVESNLFQDFTGGGYFYLDNRDRVVVGTTTRHILVIAERGAGFSLVHDYDLSGELRSNEQITSALPDSHGLLWVVARQDGVVATLNLADGEVHVMRLGNGADGEIENSLAVGAHGAVYIATNRRLYRFDAGPGGVPQIAWQVTYPNSGEHKPGQVDDGTGTTPTVMPGGYVNITDNADPMDVVVYRSALRPTRVVRVRVHGRVRRRRRRVARRVCVVPVFGNGASDTENSLIAAGRSMIVENNYGYAGPTSVGGGGVTTPGFARVDLDRDGMGCHLVWTNTSVAAPTVVSKLSLANGLIYTYTKPAGGEDPWYWTAIDFRTGKTVWTRLAGTGALYNNNYAGIALSPAGGAAFLGVLGGIISLHDT